MRSPARPPARLRILWNASASSSGLCTGFPTPHHVGRPADTADWMGICTDGWIHVNRDERWLETSVTKILALHAPSQASRPSQPDRGVAPSTVLEAFAAGPEDVVLRRLLSAPHWRVGEFGREFEGPSSACTTHICSGTCPYLRRDPPTSAPGPAPIAACMGVRTSRGCCRHYAARGRAGHVRARHAADPRLAELHGAPALQVRFQRGCARGT
jgi:hypothetical protein